MSSENEELVMGERINDFLSEKMQEDCFEIFITALGKLMKNISNDFIRQGANFIQTNQSTMHLLCNHGFIFALNPGLTLALKNLEDILECINDIMKHEENLIQN